MANWGQPDFDTKEVIDITALADRIRVEDPDAMVVWPHKGPAGYDHATVRMCCVDTSNPGVAAWQQCRLSMKGKKTHEKLDILMRWYQADGAHAGNRIEYVRVQVYNYLGALRRGGQLDDQNRIRKYI
jgi:hypothetical protein